MRRAIPQKQSDELMFKNDHTCCICRTKGKSVQIHHINGKNSNNKLENLALLCLDCHSNVTSNQGLGRRYTKGELTKYKRNWEYLINKDRKAHLPMARGNKYLLPYIETTVFEILALRDNDPRIEEKLNTIYEINLLRDYSKEILDLYSHLGLMVSFNRSKTPILLAHSIYQLSWHLMGPKYVPSSVVNKKQLEESIDILKTIGENNAEFHRKISVVKVVCENLYNFFEISLWYNLEDRALQVFSALSNIKLACLLTYTENETPLTKGAQIVENTIATMEYQIKKERPKWKLWLKKSKVKKET